MAIHDDTRRVTAGRRVVNLASDPANGAAALALHQTGRATPLSIDVLRIDQGIQMRAGGLDAARVEQYAEDMRRGDDFDPITVFNAQGVFWLADGFHRVAAARKAGLLELPAIIRQGDRRSAILFAVGANAGHGLDRTDDDKRLAVDTLLADPEWRKWVDAEIARRCRVSDPFVKKRREIMENSERVQAAMKGAPPPEPTTKRLRVDKHGNTSEIETKNLGTVNGKSGAGSRGGSSASSGAGAKSKTPAVGKCVKCGRPLTDPAHAAAGIGPCCAAKQAGAGGGESAEAARVELAREVQAAMRGALEYVPQFVEVGGDKFLATGLRDHLKGAIVAMEKIAGVEA